MLQIFPDSYHAHYYASGTGALAAAIIAAIRLKAVDRPEVILPAYGCPDLISAALFAGAAVVLVDIENDRPWMNLEQLAEKITTNTVAIIAVNLFGILEQRQALRSLAAQADTLLIEDSAQAFPGHTEKNFWQGDLIVLSFGRGKPVSLLGGGAVLFNKSNLKCNEFLRLLPVGTAQCKVNLQEQTAFRLKARLYNWMIRPKLFWLPQSLPFLHLGETRYHPLSSLQAIDRIRLSMLPANIKAYQAAMMHVQEKLAVALDKCDLEQAGIIDLPRACNISRHRRLLRYPLLVEPERRDLLYARLQQHGLGASLMYPKPLPEMPALAALLFAQGSFPAASKFSKKIITLPTHLQLTDADIAKIRGIISSF
ncbi:MAG: DegT/DnrJ/EryC1/StrS family aminotransferase [Gammaproteobacteria bacterium]|nr:DegT/DnrJ/EryC1/StrS family aminotransferase [Gammaproteobacteria bacterium]